MPQNKGKFAKTKMWKTFQKHKLNCENIYEKTQKNGQKKPESAACKSKRKTPEKRQKRQILHVENALDYEGIMELKVTI